MEGPKDWSLIWPQATIIIKSTVVSSAPPFIKGIYEQRPYLYNE